MQELNLPSYEFRLKKDDGQVRIFDEVRKKYVALTPEEWVRQHFIMYLINQKQVPAGLIILEKKLIMNKMSRRPDILIHNRQGEAVMIVECKAPEVNITQDTFDQVARYNSVLSVQYLVVTNGLQHFCCQMDYKGNTYRFLEDIPEYNEMTA
ncbi:MAG: type I restriction enzyme HsdR N-terminal domain-containing protein [Bacteroidales bacterium]|nr:type I restriction enzyme HsdR N-terminal domain-containing protein [Bacteroidota bacterium]MCK5338181.1 type I restriction enzyme HsdR N-terminal domain-containing protein [Bacteroidales bacterium]